MEVLGEFRTRAYLVGQKTEGQAARLRRDSGEMRQAKESISNRHAYYFQFLSFFLFTRATLSFSFYTQDYPTDGTSQKKIICFFWSTFIIFIFKFTFDGQQQ